MQWGAGRLLSRLLAYISMYFADGEQRTKIAAFVQCPLTLAVQIAKQEETIAP